MKRRFDHIDLRVRNLSEARAFYQALLPAIGFCRDDSNEHWIEFESAGEGVTDYFAITEFPEHQPDTTRIAFWAESAHEVDRLAAILQQVGALNVEGPAFEAPHYYAVFFEDPSGNRFEVCHRTQN